MCFIKHLGTTTVIFVDFLTKTMKVQTILSVGEEGENPLDPPCLLYIFGVRQWTSVHGGFERFRNGYIYDCSTLR